LLPFKIVDKVEPIDGQRTSIERLTIRGWHCVDSVAPRGQAFDCADPPLPNSIAEELTTEK